MEYSKFNKQHKQQQHTPFIQKKGVNTFMGKSESSSFFPPATTSQLKKDETNSNHQSLTFGNIPVLQNKKNTLQKQTVEEEAQMKANPLQKQENPPSNSDNLPNESEVPTNDDKSLEAEVASESDFKKEPTDVNYAKAKANQHIKVIEEGRIQEIVGDIKTNLNYFEGDALKTYTELIQAPYDRYEEAQAQQVAEIIDPVKEIYDKYAPSESKGRTKHSLAPLDKKIAKLEKQLANKKLSDKKKEPIQEKLTKTQKQREERKENIPKHLELENQLVAAIKEARTKIASLKDGTIKAKVNIELNEYTPYHYQIGNADILYTKGGSKAGQRTCNITCVTMVLQSLGKTPQDYKSGGNKEQLTAIANHFKPKLDDKVGTITTDFSKMSMPDFIQIAVIEHYLEDGASDEQKIEAARKKAAKKITSDALIITMLESFGVAAKAKYHKQHDKLDRFGEVSKTAGNRSKQTSDRDWEKQKEAKKQKLEDKKWYDKIQTGGKANRTDLSMLLVKIDDESATPDSMHKAVEETITGIDTRMNEIDSNYWGKKPKKQKKYISNLLKASAKYKAKPNKGNKKKLKDAIEILSKFKTEEEKKRGLEYYQHAGSFEEMQACLSIEDYKSPISGDVKKGLEQGHQFIVNLRGHYTRLQSINENGFVVDDPGGSTKQAMNVSWSEAIADGYFKRYILVTP
ncbi:MAG: hypothetical protein ACPG5B_11075 [Chitinophagales bacterium]